LVGLVGEPDANTLMSNLAGATGDLESLGPLVGLAQVAQGKLGRQAYLERYGHRGPHEMELSSPGVDDDVGWLDMRLAEFGQSPVDVEGLLAKQRAEFASAWQRFESRHPNEAARTQRQLADVASAARTREAVRSEVTRLARLVRRYVLRAGEHTALGDGVFFLTLDELSTVLGGVTAPAGTLSARRATYARYCSLPPYPALIIGHFDPFKWAADPDRRSDYYIGMRTKAYAPPTTVTGFPGAIGIVEGIVRRLDKPEDGHCLQPGEILVTFTTNVGWTPLFPRLAAIVTDVGAPLSHAAIVARELGIPAVVGCGNATARLRTGDRVRVDGSAGTVAILGTKDRIDGRGQA
jgi:phosphohistidine swiveling domain-containing protein